MRILLAALNAHKGDLDGNLARHLAVDAPPVRALLEGTFRRGVAALFGIAERAGAAFHISQVYGHGGRLGGVYRKRHLGEGEEGWSSRSPPTSPSTRSAAWSSTGPAGPCWSPTTTAGRSATGARRGAGWRPARTTWSRSAGSCARSWPATTCGSAPGSAGATTPSGASGRVAG